MAGASIVRMGVLMGSPDVVGPNVEAKATPNDHHVLQTAGSVLRDYVSGIYHEATTHPLKLAGEAALGAGIVVGGALLAPEIGVALGIAGAAAGIYEVGKGLKHLYDDAKVIDNAEGSYSNEQVNKAHQEIRQMGEFSAEVAATALGGGLAAQGLKALSIDYLALSRDSSGLVGIPEYDSLRASAAGVNRNLMRSSYTGPIVSGFLMGVSDCDIFGDRTCRAAEAPSH